jgi:hypothetical protein
MIINDIAHLCGYFSTSDADFDGKLAADPFWTQIVSTPEEVAQCALSYTGQFLKEKLQP